MALKKAVKTLNLDVLYQYIVKYIEVEVAGGLLLIFAMVAALLVSNSPLVDSYESFLMLTGEVRIDDLKVEKPLVLWVNDLWMAIFFFLVGMEIKREVLDGHLSDRSQLALPVAAAIGGMLMPGLIYVSLNYNDPVGINGWAIPTATDIAFAMGILALAGSKVPTGAKVFLMTLAILDDLGAIIIIALFYTANLSMLSLVLAGVMVALLIGLNLFGVKSIAAYVVVGLLLWVCVLKSGVHATLAGVITALAIPWQKGIAAEKQPINCMIDDLHPWIAFAILPMFAFVNTGISFQGLDRELLLGSVPVGVALGLFAGKQLGVFGFSWLALKSGLATKSSDMSLLHLYGVAALCGIGFTMSIFIGGLAFEESGMGYAGAERLAILVGSLLSAAVGFTIFRFAPQVKSSNEE